MGGSVGRVEHPSVNTRGDEVADPSVDSCSVGGLGMYVMQSFALHSPGALGELGSVGCLAWSLCPEGCVLLGCLFWAATGYSGDPDKGK